MKSYIFMEFKILPPHCSYLHSQTAVPDLSFFVRMVAVIQADWNLQTQTDLNTEQKLFWKLLIIPASLVLTAWSPFNSLDAMSYNAMPGWLCLHGICECKAQQLKASKAAEHVE